MNYGLKSTEGAALAITAAKLLLVPAIIWAVMTSLSLAVLLVAIYVCADIGDGVYARFAGCDSNSRRVLDCAIDRVSVHVGLLTAVVIQPGFLWLYLPLLVRDAAAGLASTWLIEHRKLLILGGRAHMVSSLSNAVFGLALVAASVPLIYVTGAIALFANYALLADYLGGYLWLASVGGGKHVKRVKIRNLLGLRVMLHRIPRTYRVARRSPETRERDVIRPPLRPAQP